MRQSPVLTPTQRRANVRRMVQWVALLIMAAVVVVIAYQLIGPPHAARERAIALLRRQIALLPPYPGSEAAQTTVYDEPLHDSAILVAYTLPGQCVDVQPYYAAQTAKNGWSMIGPVKVIHDPANPSLSGHDDLESDFHKEAQGDSLDLLIDCYRDQSYSPGYTFSMTAR